jgi:hypothetical protein
MAKTSSPRVPFAPYRLSREDGRGRGRSAALRVSLSPAAAVAAMSAVRDQRPIEMPGTRVTRRNNTVETEPQRQRIPFMASATGFGPAPWLRHRVMSRRCAMRGSGTQVVCPLGYLIALSQVTLRRSLHLNLQAGFRHAWLPAIIAIPLFATPSLHFFVFASRPPCGGWINPFRDFRFGKARKAERLSMQTAGEDHPQPAVQRKCLASTAIPRNWVVREIRSNARERE